MRKIVLFTSLILIIVLCCSCVEYFELPDETEISSFTLEFFSGGMSYGAAEFTDQSEIEDIHSALSDQKQMKESVSDIPSRQEYMKISFNLKDSGSRVVFIYADEKQTYMEEPYSGIYFLNNGDSVYPALYTWWNESVRISFYAVFGNMLENEQFTLPKNYSGANKASAVFRNILGDESLFHYTLSDRVRAESLEDIRFLILGVEKEEYIGEYTLGIGENYTPKAYRIDEYISIYDLSTGQIIAQNTFMGEDPPEKISDTSQNAVYGSDPDKEEMNRWINSELEFAINAE